MATQSTDFLRFSAYSIKDLITRKLSEDSRFTDQIYEGSNLAILIDLVSYMYQCLIYCLNNAASESMFQDTMVYENITRLVNLLGYQPKGSYPSSFNVYVRLLNMSDEVKANCVVLPYSGLDTGMSDSEGRAIWFSTKINNVLLDNKNTTEFDMAEDLKLTFYNGRWRMYPTVFQASGQENEVFKLEGLRADSDAAQYVSSEFIDVLVYEIGTDGKPRNYEFWTKDIDGLFTNSNNISLQTTENTTIYGQGQRVYSVRLTHDKTYEIRFGDGIVGARLPAGARVVVMYLESNGPDGEIDISGLDLTKKKLYHSAQALDMPKSLYDQVLVKALGGENTENFYPVTDYIAGKDYELDTAMRAVSKFSKEESVQQIREQAPNWFKLGNRLITAKDYEYFVMNNQMVAECFSGYQIVDVKCMNNIKFAATFYKWLYQQGIRAGFQEGGRHYFNSTFWQRTDYKYIDPADANNTYLWIKIGDIDDSDQLDVYDVATTERALNNALQPLKTLTTEIQLVKPVIVNFDICACKDLEYAREFYMSDDGAYFDEECESYIEVTLDDNALYVNNAIQQKIYDIIIEQFNVNRCKLGQNVDYAGITREIYAINGVQRIRTVFQPEDQTQTIYFDGLAFASWSPVLDDLSSGQEFVGVDLEVGNGSRQMLEFQFPRFVGAAKLKSRIKVIKRSLTTINTIKM